MWSAWFIRFVAERGWYGLYTNFQDGKAFVVNHRDAGNNFKTAQGPNSEMVSSYEHSLFHLPPLRDLPLYDFHFNKIDDPRILEDRAFYAGVSNPIIFNEKADEDPDIPN